MEISAVVDENTYEMLLKLKLSATHLTGKNAADDGDLISLYAQFEDPGNPGVYESFTCSANIYSDGRKLSYNEVWIKNYSGSRSLKEGSADVTGKTF